MPDPPHKYDYPPMGSHKTRGRQIKSKEGHDGLFQLFQTRYFRGGISGAAKVKRGLEKTRTGFFQSIVNTLTNAQIRR